MTVSTIKNPVGNAGLGAGTGSLIGAGAGGILGYLLRDRKKDDATLSTLKGAGLGAGLGGIAGGLAGYKSA